MKGSFEDVSQQIRRLMEVAGGSADAYEKTRPASEDTPEPLTKKPNPFEDPASRVEDTGLEVDQRDPTPLVDLVGEEPTLEDEELAGLCGGMITLEELLPDEKPPQPLNEDYRYVGIVVEKCGELKEIWRGFTQVGPHLRVLEIKIDSGPALIQPTPEGQWILEDPTKDRVYLRETGNLAGHLGPDDLFIWVGSLLSDLNQYHGYIHNGYVFLKEQA